MRTSSVTRPGRLILVRHGESEGNRDRTFTRDPAVALTPLGRKQARAAGLRIAARCDPSQIVASPFARARQTAAIIAEVLRLMVELEPALREQSFGTFAGRPYDALLKDATYRDGPHWQRRPPGGESLADVYARVTPVFKRLVEQGAGRDVVVVTHGGVMLALCAYVVGSWDGIAVAPNGGVVVIEHERGAC
ncbi:MAG: histidine phosphatase family protein, partial [Candidatus Binatia bacterium]